MIHLTVLAGVLVIGLIWATVGLPQAKWRRWAVSLLLCALLAYMGLLTTEFLSRPKPLDLEWRDGQIIVEHFKFIEGEAIYIWVTWPEMVEPRAYKMTWSENLAVQLEGAKQKQQEGAEGEFDIIGQLGEEVPSRESDTDRQLYQNSWDDEITFHAVPQPVPPTKPIPNTPTDIQRFRGGQTLDPRPDYNYGVVN